MKAQICLCVVLSVAAVAWGQNPFGGFMKQATDGMKQFAGMFPGMGKDGGPFGEMMKQFEGMAGQAGGPEKMLQMFQQSMGKMTDQSQEMMKPFMEQMQALQSQGASPEKFMEVMEQMKKAAGQ
ncbi:hypothetical protein AVEN_247422-1 [Araneus ventricosus]|uniref:DUF4175 domain-containing protein n=1 Tax=Araneus ventricosus TaxID=182803 RepID=A0A4Y2X4P6_ARAVE|nr:hypothetical protein AVEN_226951-1 [Araneus ventricosus]GBO44459.1 hypothetical protein AVEN_247422-1 [Araneus ventricosus]